MVKAVDEDCKPRGRDCVCGQSKKMPVCDGTHALIDAGDGPKKSIDEWLKNESEDDALGI